MGIAVWTVEWMLWGCRRGWIGESITKRSSQPQVGSTEHLFVHFAFMYSIREMQNRVQTLAGLGVMGRGGEAILDVRLLQVQYRYNVEARRTSRNCAALHSKRGQ